MDEEKYFQQHRHYRCTRCGTRSPIDAKYCSNYSCRALLATFGTVVDPEEDERRRVEEEKERERREKEAQERREEEERRRREHEEWERRQQEEAARKAKEEAERKAREEQERLKREQETRAREEYEKAYREEQECLKKEQEEEQLRQQEEAERKAREEAGRKAREDFERKQKEEEENRRREKEEKKHRKRQEKEEKREKKGKKGTIVLIIFAVFLLVVLVCALMGVDKASDSGGDTYYEDTSDDDTADDTSDDTSDDTPDDTSDDAADEGSRVLASDSNCGSVLGNEDYDRSSIQTITFLDSTQDTSARTIVDLWDASEDQDESVLVFTMDEDDDGLYDLYICADGGVIAPEDCRRLFAFYESLESIDFNGSFDMSGAANMRGMFRNCDLLTKMDLDGLDTSNVTNMSELFAYCDSLTELLNLGNLDTSEVTDMSDMFYSTSSELAEFLAENVFEDFDTSSVVRFKEFMSDTSDYDWEWLFADCDEADEAAAVWIEGTKSASADEGSENLFDSDTSTKWCITMIAKEVYVIWEMSEAISADGIRIATAADTATYPGRNPATWQLYAANGDTAPDADSDEWIMITQVKQSDALPTTSEKYFRYYFYDLQGEYQYYKLVITETTGDDTMQISELELLY